MEIRDFNSIDLSSNKWFPAGSEADAILINDGVFKIFYDNLTDEQIKRKVRKLYEVNRLQEKFNTPDIYYLVKSQDRVIGYVMEYIKGKSIEEFNYKKKIHLLKSIRDLVFELQTEGIYFYGLRDSNIIIKHNKPYFIDIEGIQTAHNEMEIMPTYLKKYLELGGRFGYDALVYTFNMFTMLSLVDDDYGNDYNKSICKEYFKVQSSGRIPKSEVLLNRFR